MVIALVVVLGVVLIGGGGWVTSDGSRRITGAAAPTRATSPGRVTGSSDALATATPATSASAPFAPIPSGATADCSAPDGVDAAGVTQTYEPAKAFDGRADTAWRCSGDATGRTLIVSFAGPVQLTSVGLVPGYDKVDSTDGSDRFRQSRTVTRVRWTFDDGTTVEASPNGERRMSTTPVSVRTSTVRLTIEQTAPGSVVTNSRGEALAPLDTTAVSEIAFAGLR